MQHGAGRRRNQRTVDPGRRLGRVAQPALQSVQRVQELVGLATVLLHHADDPVAEVEEPAREHQPQAKDPARDQIGKLLDDQRLVGRTPPGQQDEGGTDRHHGQTGDVQPTVDRDRLAATQGRHR